MSMYYWEWHPQSGSISYPCGTSNPCLMNVPVSGTMIAHTWGFGDASANVTVYSSFTLNANPSSVYIGDSIAFTPSYDGVAGPAARWGWFPSDTATIDPSCRVDRVSCSKVMVVSGQMRAYTSLTPGQGDSAVKDVSVLMRSLSLTADPAESGEGDTVTFTGALDPPTANVQATWSWVSDTAGGVVADRSGGSPASTSNRGWYKFGTAKGGLRRRQFRLCSRCERYDNGQRRRQRHS